MKHSRLFFVALCSLFVGGLRESFSTANAKDEPANTALSPGAPDDIVARLSALEKSGADREAALNETIATQQAQISELQKQLGVASAPKPEGESPLDLMIKGARLDPDKVKWRVAAGLTPEQAIDAARSQAVYDKAREKSEKQAAAQKAAAQKAAAEKAAAKK